MSYTTTCDSNPLSDLGQIWWSNLLVITGEDELHDGVWTRWLKVVMSIEGELPVSVVCNLS